MTTRPVTPAGARPEPEAHRIVASPASQTLAAMAAVVALVGLAVRMDSPAWFAAPTAALLLGIVLGLGLDLRRAYARVPGLAAALATLVLLSVLWGVSLGSFETTLPYAPIPLAAIAVFGADWWWVERLRPTTVATGALLISTLFSEDDTAATLPLALVWFAVATATLWSLRRDAERAVPAPVPLDGSAAPAREPGAGRTVVAVAASWLVAGAIVALVGLAPLWFDPPEVTGRLGGDARVITPDSVGGPGWDPSGGDGGAGGDLGPDGAGSQDTIGAGGSRDVDGDGIVDRDIDGDGIPDVDIDGDGIPDVDRDGDGIPDGSAGTAADPGGASGDAAPDGGPPPADGRTARLVEDGDDARAVLRAVGAVVVVLLAVALVAVAVRAAARERARRRALAARPWAVRLAERLEREGARRGRVRRRDEPVTRYATALAGGVLAHDRLAEVGAALSTALFGGRPPAEGTAEWAARVLDEAVAANPRPTRRTAARGRLRRRGPGAPTV